MCASRVGVKGQLLAGAGRCVRGLVKLSQLRVYYTSADVLRVLIASGCDTVGRVALLVHVGRIRLFQHYTFVFALLPRITNMK